MKLFKYFVLISKNIRRNLLRTILTALATIVLVFVTILVWSVLYFLDRATSEKSQNFKAIVTEQWQLPSQMPFAYADSLAKGAANKPGDVIPSDSMTWQFYGGTLDPQKRTRDNIVFAFAMDPAKLMTMMDDLDTLPADQNRALKAAVEVMKTKRNALIVGRERLAAINKRVGERVTLSGLNYKDIDLEFEIIGILPEGRYNQSAVMNRDYLNDALDSYPKNHNLKKHPLADKTLNLVWIKLPDSQAFQQVAEQIGKSPLYTTPSVKCETASSGIAAFLEAYKDLIKGMRWVLTPAILATLSLVIANAISISIRERRAEMAVLKVLGFQPRQILALVLGEALFIGTGAGLVSAILTYGVINFVLGGVKFPIAFFPAFFIPLQALVWGVCIGALTSLAGSILPAWSARTVKVSDVFSKVA